MTDLGSGERGAARLIRAGELGRMGALPSERANDNRRRIERSAPPLARAVLAAAPATAAGLALRREPARPEPQRGSAAPAVPAVALAEGWLGHQLALWTAALGTASRLPPVASGLAVCRAWTEIGWAGAASCASLAATGSELVGLALGGVWAAPAGRPHRPGATGR